MLLFLIGCNGPPAPVFDDTAAGTGSTTDTHGPGDLVSNAGADHCGEIGEDEVWASDLSPHVLSCVVRVNGGTLTVGPGVVVQAAAGAGLVVAEALAATLQVLGTEAEPVVFEPDVGAGERGHWQGLLLNPATGLSAPELHWTTIDGGGLSDGVHRPAGLFVETPDVIVEQVTVRNTAGYGFALSAAGSFASESHDLHVQLSEASAFAEVWATGTIPTGDLTGNDVDAIDLPGGSVLVSARWDAKDVAYRLINDAYVDGTAEAPVTLTLGPGTNLRFGDGRGLYVGTSGPAALQAVGTAESPIVFSGDRKTAGAWAGVGIRAQDTGSVLAHFELAYGGASFPLDGALHLEDAAAQVDHGSIHDNAECGVWLEDGTSEVGPDVVYADNAGGDLCRP